MKTFALTAAVAGVLLSFGVEAKDPAWYRAPNGTKAQLNWQATYGNNHNSRYVPMSVGTSQPAAVWHANLWDLYPNMTGAASDITIGGGAAFVQSYNKDGYMFLTSADQADGAVYHMPVGRCAGDDCYADMFSGLLWNEKTSSVISAIFDLDRTFVSSFDTLAGGNISWTYESPALATTQCLTLLEDRQELHYLWFDNATTNWNWVAVNATDGKEIGQIAAFKTDFHTTSDDDIFFPCNLARYSDSLLIGLADGYIFGLDMDTGSRTWHRAVNNTLAKKDGFFVNPQYQVITFPEKDMFLVSYIAEKEDDKYYPIIVDAYTNAGTKLVPTLKWQLVTYQYNDGVLRTISADDEEFWLAVEPPLPFQGYNLADGKPFLSKTTGKQVFFYGCEAAYQWKITATEDFLYALCKDSVLSIWEKSTGIMLNVSMDELVYEMRDCYELSDLAFSGGWLYGKCDGVMWGIQAWAPPGFTTTAIPTNAPVTTGPPTPVPSTTAAPPTTPVPIPSWYRAPKIDDALVWQPKYGSVYNMGYSDFTVGTALPRVGFVAGIWDDYDKLTGISSSITVGGGFAFVQGANKDKYVFLTIIEQDTGVASRIPITQCRDECLVEDFGNVFYNAFYRVAISALWNDKLYMSAYDVDTRRTLWDYEGYGAPQCMQYLEYRNEIHYLYTANATGWVWVVVNATTGKPIGSEYGTRILDTFSNPECSIAQLDSGFLVAIADGYIFSWDLEFQKKGWTTAIVPKLKDDPIPLIKYQLMVAQGMFFVQYLLDYRVKEMTVCVDAYYYDPKSPLEPKLAYYIREIQYDDLYTRSLATDGATSLWLTVNPPLAFRSYDIKTGKVNSNGPYYPYCDAVVDWKLTVTNDYMFALCKYEDKDRKIDNPSLLTIWERSSGTMLSQSMEELYEEMKYCAVVSDIAFSGGWLYATCEGFLYGIQIWAQEGVTTTALPTNAPPTTLAPPTPPTQPTSSGSGSGHGKGTTPTSGPSTNNGGAKDGGSSGFGSSDVIGLVVGMAVGIIAVVAVVYFCTRKKGSARGTGTTPGGSETGGLINDEGGKQYTSVV